MKVAIVVSDPNHFGGVNKVTSSVTGMLKTRGHELALCALRKPIRGKCFKEYSELQHVYVPTSFSKLAVKGTLLKNVIQVSSAMKTCSKQFKPDAAICFTEPACFRGIRNTHIIKILYVHFPTEIKVRNHALPYLIYRIPYWYWHYKLLPSLHAMVCNSQYTREITYAFYQYIVPEQQKYHVIYPPVNTKEFEKSAKKEDKICYVGRIDALKGIHYVVESYLRICRTINIRLDIVGAVSKAPWRRTYYENHFKPYISRLQKKYPISLKVNVPYEEIVETLLTSKMMLSYNPTEHFGIVPVEAQAAGCIPIVADGGGQRETVIHGEVGFRAKHPHELDKYVKLVLSDDYLRTKMSEKAKQWAENFSFNRIGDTWTHLFELIRK